VSQLKKVWVSLPDALLSEMDRIAVVEQSRRSYIMREAIQQYIEQFNRRLLVEQMKKGYQEMATINLTLAIEHYCLEAEVTRRYELPGRG